MSWNRIGLGITNNIVCDCSSSGRSDAVALGRYYMRGCTPNRVSNKLRASAELGIKQKHCKGPLVGAMLHYILPGTKGLGGIRGLECRPQAIRRP